MKVISLLAAVLCGGTVIIAGEGSPTKLQSTATQLDELVSDKDLYRKVGVKGFKQKREKVPPLELSQITSTVSAKLGVQEKDVREILQNDREKLSEIVMARALETPTGTAWKSLFDQNDGAALVRMAQEKNLVQQVQKTLDEIYTEVSFIAIDRNMQQGQGRPPGSTRGNGSSKQGKR